MSSGERPSRHRLAQHAPRSGPGRAPAGSRCRPRRAVSAARPSRLRAARATGRGSWHQGIPDHRGHLRSVDRRLGSLCPSCAATGSISSTPCGRLPRSRSSSTTSPRSRPESGSPSRPPRQHPACRARAPTGVSWTRRIDLRLTLVRPRLQRPRCSHQVQAEPPVQGYRRARPPGPHPQARGSSRAYAARVCSCSPGVSWLAQGPRAQSPGSPTLPSGGCAAPASSPLARCRLALSVRGIPPCWRAALDETDRWRRHSPLQKRSRQRGC